MEKARIMIVEDEKLVALAIEKALKGMGYEVPLSLASGEEAVRRVAEAAPDLVLMDIRLEGKMDGIEAADHIKASHHIPVVYLTAYSEKKTLERAKFTEPFGFIVKPIDERTLQATVEMALYKAAIEGQLWRTKEKLETILRCFAEGVVVMDTLGVIEYLNPMADKILLPFEKLQPGTTLDQLLHVLNPETLEPAELPFERVLNRRESAEVTDLILATKAQGRLRVDVIIAPLRSENGTVQGMILAFHDVTERERMREVITRGLHQALELQKALLPPREVKIPGLEAAWFFQPSSFAAGDLFSAFSINETSAGVYMIDVAGRGIASAVNAQLLHRLLAFSRGSDGPRFPLIDADPLAPGSVVEKLVARFGFDGSAPFFALLYATADTRSGKVTLVLADQPFPIVHHANGTVQVLRVQSREFGSDSHFLEHELQLSPGDRLYLYSDGAVECPSPDMEQFSESRLVEAIAKTRSSSLEAAVAAVGDDIVRWRGTSSLDDDICIMAIQMA